MLETVVARELDHVGLRVLDRGLVAGGQAVPAGDLAPSLLRGHRGGPGVSRMPFVSRRAHERAQGTGPRLGGSAITAIRGSPRWYDATATNRGFPL